MTSERINSINNLFKIIFNENVFTEPDDKYTESLNIYDFPGIEKDEFSDIISGYLVNIDFDLLKLDIKCFDSLEFNNCKFGKFKNECEFNDCSISDSEFKENFNGVLNDCFIGGSTFHIVDLYDIITENIIDKCTAPNFRYNKIFETLDDYDRLGPTISDKDISNETLTNDCFFEFENCSFDHCEFYSINFNEMEYFSCGSNNSFFSDCSFSSNFSVYNAFLINPSFDIFPNMSGTIKLSGNIHTSDAIFNRAPSIILDNVTFDSHCKKEDVSSIMEHCIKINGLEIEEVNLEKYNYENSEMSSVEFSNCSFDQTIFRNANLSDILFSNSDLVLADFSSARLYKVNFNNCDLKGADFNGAILENIDFSGTDLSEVDLSGAQLIECVGLEV